MNIRYSLRAGCSNGRLSGCNLGTGDNSGGASHPSKPKTGARRGPRDPSPARKQFNQESCMVRRGFRVLSGKGSQSTVGLLAKLGDQTGLFLTKPNGFNASEFMDYLRSGPRFSILGKETSMGGPGAPDSPCLLDPSEISSHWSRRQKETKGGLGPPSSMACCLLNRKCDSVHVICGSGCARHDAGDAGDQNVFPGDQRCCAR